MIKMLKFLAFLVKRWTWKDDDVILVRVSRAAKGEVVVDVTHNNLKRMTYHKRAGSIWYDAFGKRIKNKQVKHIKALHDIAISSNIQIGDVHIWKKK